MKIADRDCEIDACRRCSGRSWHFGMALLVAFGSVPCLAAGWETFPLLTVRAGYDDNQAMNPVQDNGGYEYSGSGALGLNRNTEMSQLGGEIRADYIDHARVEGAKAESNQYANLFYRYQVGERNGVGLDSSFTNAYTGANHRVLTNGSVSPGEPGSVPPGDNVDTDVGLTRRQYRRTSMDVTPYWDHEFTEKTQARLDYSYLEQTYSSSGVEQGLTEYETQRPSLRINHELNPRDHIDIAFSGLFYKATSRDKETDSYAVMTGFSRSFTETTSFRVAVGVRYVESKAPNTEQKDDMGGLFRVEGTRQLERGRITGKVERSLSPSGSGNIVESDVFALRVTKPISERTALMLQSQYVSNGSSDGAQGGNNGRDYFRIEPGLRYSLSETWSIDLSYTYRWEDREQEVSSADSNAVYLSVNYTPLSEF